MCFNQDSIQALGTSGLVMQAGGVLNNTVGTMFAARGQKAAFNQQAQIADMNAKLSETSAQAALQAGQREEQTIDMNTTNTKATQRASFGANGVDISGGGSPVAVLNSTDVMGQADANTAKLNAIRQAWGYRTQGANYTAEGIVDRGTAKSINPGMQAESALMTGAGQVAQSWYSLSKTGALYGNSRTGYSNDPKYSRGGGNYGPFKDNGY